MSVIMCPVCGEMTEGEPDGGCVACGATLPPALFEKGRQEAEAEEEIRRQRKVRRTVDGEETDELLVAFREQFERRRIRIPPTWADRLRYLAGEVEPSRRLVTVIFVDLRGYSHLTSQLTEQQFDRLHEWYYELCTRRVELHGGFVVRFIGDAIYGAFGAPASFERDAESAVRAMLEIKEEIREKGTFEGHPLAIRGGADSGMVSVRPIDMQGKKLFDLFGSTVNLAARLQDRADTGEILVSETVADQVRGIFELEAKDPFIPKNFSHAVTPSSVQGIKHAEDIERRSEFRLVGRQSELDVIAGWVDRIQRGEFVKAQILGEPGVGKSRLIKEALERIRSRGIHTARFECEPHTQYSLLEGALWLARSIATASLPEPRNVPLSAEEILEAIRIGFPELEPYALPNIAYAIGIPTYIEALRFLPTSQIRSQVVGSLSALIREACRLTPWIIFIDDAQWCDRLTLEVLARVIELKPAGLLLMICGRSRVAVLEEKGEDDWQKLLLNPLPEEAMQELLAEILDFPNLHPIIRNRLLRETEGIPLYLIELAQNLGGKIDDPTILSKGLSEQGENVLGLPPLVFDVLQSRIDRLGTQKRALLQCGAVLGRQFRFQMIELFEEAEEDLLGELLALKGLRLLRDEPLPEDILFYFTPTVLRDVAYQMLTADQKLTLHRIIAERIERRFGGRLTSFSFELAFHWLNAGDLVRAQRYLKKAAEQAIVRGNPYDAYELVKKALNSSSRRRNDASEGEPAADLLNLQQKALLESLAGQACRLMGNYEKSDEHFNAFKYIAENTTNPRWTADVNYQLAVNHHDQGRFHLAEEEFGKLSVAKGGDSLFHAKVVHALGSIKLRTGRHEEALADFVTVAEELATLDQIVPTMADALVNAGLVHWQKGNLDEAETYFTRGLELWRRLNNVFGQIHALSNLGMLADMRGRFKDAQHHYDSAGRRAEEIGYLRGITIIEANRSNLSLLFQDWREAQRHASHALQAARMIGHPYSEGVALENLGLALAGLGLIEEASKALEESIDLSTKLNDPARRDSARLSSAWVALAQRHFPAQWDPKLGIHVT